MEKLSETEEDKKDSIWTGPWGFLIIASFVILIWFANWHIMLSWFEHADHAGPAGDLFGAATSLFSGLAFAGLISTLMMQRQELRLQWEQLKVQNRELKQQHQELKDTRKEFEIQRFESRLFGMIKLLNDHVNSFKYSEHVMRNRQYETDYFQGRAVLNHWLKDIGVDYDHSLQDLNELPLEEFKLNYETAYDRRLEQQLGTYFRLLYNILRQINSQVLSDNETEDLESKKNYAAIVRAQLSSEEVILLMLNGVSDVGKPFIKQIQDYALLEHLPMRHKGGKNTLLGFYGPAAFGKRAHLFFDDIEEPQAQ